MSDTTLPRRILVCAAIAGATGVPKYNDSGTIRMLESGHIRLSHDGMTRTVAVSPLTARVTVQ